MTDERHPKTKAGRWLMHFTDEVGHKSIASQRDWTFKAARPPGDNNAGVYFTTLAPDEPNFSARTRIPKAKQVRVFAFVGHDGLQPKRGGKGAYIFWTSDDYVVPRGDDVANTRQRFQGPVEELP